MPTRPRVLEFDVTVDAAGDARSALGGSPIPERGRVVGGAPRARRPRALHAREHRLRSEARRARVGRHREGARRRDEARDDGLYAFVTIDTTLDVSITPAPDAATVAELVAKAERGCFVWNSLTARPRHRWIVNGEEIA